MKVTDSSKMVRGFCVLAVILSGSVAAQAEKTGSVGEVVKTETAERVQKLEELQQRQQEACRLFKEGKFEESEKIFKDLTARLADATGTRFEALRTEVAGNYAKMCTAWGESVLEQARQLAAEGKYEEAISLSSDAVTRDPNIGSKVSSFKDYCRRKQRGMEFAAATDLKVFAPEQQANADKIEELIRKAQTFYNNRRYDEAINNLERVLLIEPSNMVAISMLDKVYGKLYSYADLRRGVEAAGISAMAAWDWIKPLPVAEITTHIQRRPEIKATTNATFSRMERTVFPAVEFDKASIASVIRFLDRGSRRFDPDGVGVSVVYKPGADGASSKTVTMNLTRIPMNEVLRYLCQMLDFKYRIDEGIVFIGPEVDEMQTQHFPVRGNLMQMIMGSSAPAAAPAEDGEEAAPAPAGGMKTDSFDPGKAINFFRLCGVNFDSGSSISYDSRNTRLIVRNNAENLRRLSELLRQFSAIETPMIMTEVKFIQIEDTDIDELGFNWTFSASNQTAGDPWSINADSSNMRFGSLSNVDSGSDAKFINDLKIFPNFGEKLFGNTDVNLSLSVTALSRNTRSEMLSAPRLISASGQQATVRMVERKKFPESWDAPEINTNDNNSSVTFPIPELGEYVEDGITLTVKPQVLPDNYTIELELNPSIITYSQTSEGTYNVPVEMGYIMSDGTKRPDAGYPKNFEIWMPTIHNRQIKVRVKVYDGETIVLGGIVNNQIEKRDDRIPVLGDIPFLGRFFQSKREYNQKVNLLVFVTARLINNDGQPVRRNNNNGAPSLN